MTALDRVCIHLYIIMTSPRAHSWVDAVNVASHHPQFIPLPWTYPHSSQRLPWPYTRPPLSAQAGHPLRWSDTCCQTHPLPGAGAWVSVVGCPAEGQNNRKSLWTRNTSVAAVLRLSHKQAQSASSEVGRSTIGSGLYMPVLAGGKVSTDQIAFQWMEFQTCAGSQDHMEKIFLWNTVLSRPNPV